jgi:tetratricopeptide (TPR) repeat protein
VARGAARRTGSPVREADVEAALGFALGQLGRYPEAEAACQRAVEIAEKAARGRTALWNGLVCLGEEQSMSQQNQRAAATLERAVAVAIADRGADHPEVAHVLFQLGLAEVKLGKLPEARGHLERARDLAQATGVDSVSLAGTLAELARLDFTEGKLPEARAGAERARDMMQALAPGRHELGMAEMLLARILDASHQPLAVWDEHFARGMAILERERPPDDPGVAGQRAMWGQALARAGATDRAKALLEQALASTERTHDRRAAVIAMVIGNLHTDRQQWEQAIPYYERALAGLENGEDPRNLTVTRWNFAIALGHTHRDDRRATALARAALDGYRALGKPFEREIAEIEAWLRSHR